MKAVIGLILIVGGALFGAYMGIWWAFVGGIVDVLEQVRADEMSSVLIAIGVAKVFFCGLIGVLSGIVPVAIGRALID